MSFKSQKEKIINIGKKLLADGTVQALLAYGRGVMEGTSAPCFFHHVEELENMKWDDTCTPNLAKYLTEKKEKIAIIAKPCDVRAIVMYLVEKQIDRNNVYIIGVDCPGMKEKDGMPAAGCGECEVRIPPLYDVRIENLDIPSENPDIPKEAADFASKEKKRKENQEYSLERFQNEIKKCIMCFACRQACYGCYCKTCFVDRNIPNWLPADVNMGTKMVYHLGRAMHLAGRCIECGACERVCPSGVKIRYLIQEITDACKELYGYSAGMNPDETPAIAAFSAGDREVGFLGGEEDGSRINSEK